MILVVVVFECQQKKSYFYKIGTLIQIKNLKIFYNFLLLFFVTDMLITSANDVMVMSRNKNSIWYVQLSTPKKLSGPN